MEYIIDIKGMHCDACSNLITMYMEEEGFSNVKVDRNVNIGIFESNLNENRVKDVLDKIFSNPDLKEYSYQNLATLSHNNGK